VVPAVAEPALDDAPSALTTPAEDSAPAEAESAAPSSSTGAEQPEAALSPPEHAEEPPVSDPSPPAPSAPPAAELLAPSPMGVIPSAALASPPAWSVPSPTPTRTVPPPLPSLPTAPPSYAASNPPATLGARLTAAQERFITAIPPPWLALARRQPVLWMVVTPAVLASLLVLLAVAFSPEVQARPEPSTPATASSPDAAPSAAPAAPEAEPKAAPVNPHVAAPESPDVSKLEGKPADALSVDEVLLLRRHRADKKRKDAEAVTEKLERQPDSAREDEVRRGLLRLAADPDTAEVALVALARAPSAAAKDVLYEISTSRFVPPATAELATSLLNSGAVRAAASPALAAAIALRSATTCEAVQAALPQVQASGDRRSLASLGKLSSRRGCGADKSEDCYPCLRSQTKEVTATINAAKRRKSPGYVGN
jgi:hypothetical protein